MTPILAELTGLETAGLICAIIFGGIGSLVGVIAMFKKQEVAVQQPVDIQIIEQFVSKAEFNAHVATVNREIFQLREIFRKEIPEMERRISEAGENRVGKLHDRINDVLSEVSTLEGKIEEGFKTR